MKNKMVFIFLFYSVSIFAQNMDSNNMFENWFYSVNVGTNFNTIPTMGTTTQFSLKTNLTSKLFTKISFGYSTFYDNNSHNIKSYRLTQGPADNLLYQTRLIEVNRIKYEDIPISLGFEYLFLETDFSPILLFEFGYNFSTSQREEKIHNGIAGYYSNYEEVPIEYQNTIPELDDGSSYNIGLGIGVQYKLGKGIYLNISYIYQYNNSIINTNIFLVGVTI